MRIPPVLTPRLGQPEALRSPHGVTAGAGVDNTIPTIAGGYSPDPELGRLTDLVKQTPEVRQERVDQVSSQLTSGAYLTQDAARQTAAAVLTDGVLNK